MAATRMAYQIWDDESGNIIARYETQAEAMSFLQSMLEASGPGAVSELAVIEYPANGSAPVTILEGADFLANCSLPV